MGGENGGEVELDGTACAFGARRDSCLGSVSSPDTNSLEANESGVGGEYEARFKFIACLLQ